MSVNATFTKCDQPLENDILIIDDGSQVQISKCPTGHGKIKSPLCCGADMTCSLGQNKKLLICSLTSFDCSIVAPCFEFLIIYKILF